MILLHGIMEARKVPAGQRALARTISVWIEILFRAARKSRDGYKSGPENVIVERF